MNYYGIGSLSRPGSRSPLAQAPSLTPTSTTCLRLFAVSSPTCASSRPRLEALPIFQAWLVWSAALPPCRLLLAESGSVTRQASSGCSSAPVFRPLCFWPICSRTQRPDCAEGLVLCQDERWCRMSSGGGKHWTSTCLMLGVPALRHWELQNAARDLPFRVHTRSKAAFTEESRIPSSQGDALVLCRLQRLKTSLDF